MANSIHVTPHKDGWQVKTSGKTRASKVCDTQQDCIIHATEQAKNNSA